jgi:uncharacterized repeat protein (TIGR01451 family)
MEAVAIRQHTLIKRTPAFLAVRSATWQWVGICIAMLLAAQGAWAQCTVAIQPVVSNCYNTTAGSRATISVEVSWTNTTPGTIVITAGALSRTLITGSVSVTYQGPVSTTGSGIYSLTAIQPIVSPQLVTFELPANGASVNVQAAYTGQAGCTASQAVTLPAACAKQTCTTSTTALQGSVFRDFGSDGIRGPTEELGIDAVVVRAIACNSAVYSTTTDVNGDYSLSIPASQYPVRLEFTNLPAAMGLGTQNGTDGRTTVQFVNAPSCNNSLGVLSPADYCQGNPRVFIPCYVNGDPLATPPAGLAATAVSGTTDALVSFDYAASGIKGSAPITMEATAAQVGTVWGVAYDKTRNRVYTSATIRRHAGLGPLGLGGIYITDPATNITSSLLSVTALGVDVGTIASNTARGLVADKTAPSVDTEAWVKIGRAGIGDIDINENDRRLYFTNLFDKRVYYLTLGGTAGTPTVTLGGSFALPITCTNGELRPFALKVYDGQVFVGAVCDASVSQNKSDLRAYVFAFNPANNTTTEVMDFPLTYPKGPPFLNFATGTGNTGGANLTGWYPWLTRANPGAEFVSKSYVNNSTRYLQYPEPILTDIEFDIDGSMILGFGDVTGLQGGFRNVSPDPASSVTANAFAGGDVLRAVSSGVAFILENNGQVGGATGTGVNNAQGPGLGEFYNDDFLFTGGRLAHTEVAFGGLALLPGSGEVMVTAMDPVDLFNNAGGVRKLSNTTGQTKSALEVYATLRGGAGTFSKSVGLGDLELTCLRPTYLQIGNRVWKDTDGDGEQDACEEPLAGVRVALYQSGTLVTTTLTNANGEYYFTYEPASSTLTYPGSTSALLPETAYQIAFGQGGQWGSDILSIDGGRYRLTTPNSISGGTRSDRSDSDAQIVSVGGTFLPAIPITTGLEGTVNHTLDAGFVCLPASAVVSTTAATCSGVTALSNAVVSLSAIQNANRVFLVAAGGTLPSYTATGSQPVSASAASFTGLANPTSTSGQSYSVVLYNGPCCFTVLQTVLPRTDCACSVSLTLGTPVCNSVTNQYTVSGTVSFTNAGNTLTISDGAATTTVSATGTSPVSFTLSGVSLVSNSSSHTLTVVASSTASCTISQTYLAPDRCQPLASLGNYVFLDNDRDGTQSAADTPISGVTVTLFRNGSAVATTTTDAAGLYSFTGLTPGSSNSYSVGFTAPSGLTSTTANVGSGTAADGLDSDADPLTGRTQSVTLAPGEDNPTLDAGFLQPPLTYALSKTANRNRVEKGQMVTYTVSLTNTSIGSSGTLVLTDQFSSTAATPVGSASASVGTFTPGLSGGTWSIPDLAGGQVATLSWTVQLNEEGITYNTITLPGQQTATVCTSVPARVCESTPFQFDLTAPASYSTYQWSRNGVAIPGATSATYSATAVGEYTVSTTATAGCPNGSCCPFIIVADPAPSLSAVGIAATCIGVTPQTNAAITLASSSTNAVSYNITVGSSFSAAAPLFGSPQPLSAVVGGVLAAQPTTPAVQSGGTYTIRVYTAEGCFADTVVIIPPANCVCPPPRCIPYVVRKTK